MESENKRRQSGGYAKTSKRLIRAVKQSRIHQVRASARYQHGFQVPKDFNDAIRLDKENSNTHWQDAMDLELTQIHEYKVFKDTGKAQFHDGKAVTPDGFQKIRVHFVYAVKHDGKFKARLVADGHLTKEPVVSLRSLRMVVFLSQLNDFEIWGADVGNAYLEAYTDQKLCIIAGPEFKELQGSQLSLVSSQDGDQESRRGQCSDCNGKQSKEYFHRVTGHAGHHLMGATAKYHKVDLTGKVNNCLSCSLEKIRQKNIPKKNEDKSKNPGERMYLGIPSMRKPSMGGRQHCVMLVDKATKYKKTFFLKTKNEQVEPIIDWIKALKARHKIQVKIIRCDNTGENKVLERESDKNELGIIFEYYSPRDTTAEWSGGKSICDGYGKS